MPTNESQNGHNGAIVIPGWAKWIVGVQITITLMVLGSVITGFLTWNTWAADLDKEVALIKNTVAVVPKNQDLIAEIRENQIRNSALLSALDAIRGDLTSIRERLTLHLSDPKIHEGGLELLRREIENLSTRVQRLETRTDHKP